MILITGVKSFVGKHLVNELKKRNLKFIGIDLNVKNSRFFKKIDIRDPEVEKYLSPKTTIIHLAALSTDKLCVFSSIEKSANRTISSFKSC